MNWWSTLIFLPSIIYETNGIRINKLFQFIDGYESNHQLQGFLHRGVDYSIFLQVPKPHDTFLVYELYDTRKMDDLTESTPRALAISKVPLEYIKEQLKIFQQELHRAKYDDGNIVPGTEVKTLREWQLEQAVNAGGGSNLNNTKNYLRIRM